MAGAIVCCIIWVMVGEIHTTLLWSAGNCLIHNWLYNTSILEMDRQFICEKTWNEWLFIVICDNLFISKTISLQWSWWSSSLLRFPYWISRPIFYRNYISTTNFYSINFSLSFSSLQVELICTLWVWDWHWMIKMTKYCHFYLTGQWTGNPKVLLLYCKYMTRFLITFVQRALLNFT